MKLKNYIMLLGLFMVLMCCAGSLSAQSVDSMNSTVGDVDEIDDVISQIDDENEGDLLSVEENDGALKLEPSDFRANISSEVDLADEDADLAVVYCPEGAKGAVYLFIDDGNGYAKKSVNSFAGYDAGDIMPFPPGGFKNLGEGTYNARLVWNNNTNNVTLKEGKINVYMTITPEDFGVTPSSEVTESDEVVANVWNFPTKGELSAFVDGKKRYSKTISNKNDEVDIYADELGITWNGNYEILLKFNSVSNREVTIMKFNLTVDSNEASLYNIININDPDAPVAYLNFLSYIDGRVIVSIAGKEVYNEVFSPSQKLHKMDINVSSLNLSGIDYGKYSVSVTYTSSSGDRISDTHNVDLIKIYCPENMSAGDDEALIFKCDSGISGFLNLYNAVYKKGDYIKGKTLVSGRITNGYGKLSLSELTEGTHKLYVEYMFGNTYNDAEVELELHSVTVHKNSANFTSSISPSSLTVGNPVSVRLNGPALSGDVVIYLDGDMYKTLPFNGQISESISGLSAGAHYITVKFNGSGSFYSKTYQVNVKPVAAPPKTVTKLTLKKVSVKKSAKKLVLTATLKINNKVAKGKKITFKFNGKKYTARTNNKGVAKVTIKKNVLKKLKPGKKVKIHASFGKTTKKLTVKVKR